MLCYVMFILGWEMSVFYVLVYVLMFLFKLLCCFVFGCYTCLFDCKCKSLKRLGEHIQYTTQQHIHKHNKQTETTLRNKQQHKHNISSPRPDRE